MRYPLLTVALLTALAVPALGQNPPAQSDEHAGADDTLEVDNSPAPPKPAPAPAPPAPAPGAPGRPGAAPGPTLDRLAKSPADFAERTLTLSGLRINSDFFHYDEGRANYGAYGMSVQDPTTSTWATRVMHATGITFMLAPEMARSVAGHMNGSSERIANVTFQVRRVTLHGDAFWVALVTEVDIRDDSGAVVSRVTGAPVALREP
jgi:hypothetical protein